LRASLQETAEAGFNTNYASSWHLVRTAPILRGNSGVASTVGGLKDWYNSSGVQTTLGPLNVRALDNGDVPASSLPFLGCATQGDVDQQTLQGDGILPETISESRGLIAGSPVAESFNDGPARSNGSDAVLLIEAGTSQAEFQVAQFQNKGERAEGNLILQDTRDWFAYHSKSVNVVFADGSVRAIEDLNDDGFVNPGFAVDPAAASFVNTGYTSSEVEVEPWEMFNGTFLRMAGATKKFEN